MATNNVNVHIPQQDTPEAMLALAASTIAAAGGLTPSEDGGTYWLIENELGLRFRISGSYAKVVAVGYGGVETELVSSISLTAGLLVIYNKSTKGTAFAFTLCAGGASAESRQLQVICATDSQGGKHILSPRRATNLQGVWITSGRPALAFNTQACFSADIDIVSMIKLPNMIAPGSFAELYLVLATPENSYGEDASIYSQGCLYKTIPADPSASTDQLLFAMKVT